MHYLDISMHIYHDQLIFHHDKSHQKAIRLVWCTVLIAHQKASSYAAWVVFFYASVNGNIGATPARKNYNHQT